MACCLCCRWLQAVPRLRAPCGLCTGMGLLDRFVGPGSGSAGRAVAPAGFVASWVRVGWGLLGRFFGVGLPSVCNPLCRQLVAGGFNFPLVVCGGGPLRAGGLGLR